MRHRMSRRQRAEEDGGLKYIMSGRSEGKEMACRRLEVE